MTKRYPLRGALGGGDARDARDFQRIALGIFKAAHGAQHLGRHAHEGMRSGSARGDGLRGNVHHTDVAARVVMREFRHCILCRGRLLRRGARPPAQAGWLYTSTGGRTETFAPAGMLWRSAGTTIKQLARVSVAISPEPCQSSGQTSGEIPVHSKLAGRKCVSPGFSCKVLTRLASSNGNWRGWAPPRTSIAGVTKS